MGAVSRRGVLASGATAALTVAASSTALPQSIEHKNSVGGSGMDRELKDILSQAIGLNVSGPQSAAATLPRPLDLAEFIENALAKGPEDEDAANLARRAGLVLSELTRNRRDGLDFLPTEAVPASTKYKYSQLKQEYAVLFRQAQTKIIPTKLPELARAARFIISASASKRYKQVESDTGIPWYVIGALHYREADLNFMGHLHNGDPLLMRTIHVPKNKPPSPWPPADIRDPRELWRISAKDALQKLSTLITAWTVQQMCYGFEAYNGFGCRDKNVKSPYLWNYTYIYTGGGFPRDHVFDPNYKSKQAGVVAIIVELHKLDPDGVQLRFDI